MTSATLRNLDYSKVGEVNRNNEILGCSKFQGNKKTRKWMSKHAKELGSFLGPKKEEKKRAVFYRWALSFPLALLCCPCCQEEHFGWQYLFSYLDVNKLYLMVWNSFTAVSLQKNFQDTNNYLTKWTLETNPSVNQSINRNVSWEYEFTDTRELQCYLILNKTLRLFMIFILLKQIANRFFGFISCNFF